MIPETHNLREFLASLEKAVIQRALKTTDGAQGRSRAPTRDVAQRPFLQTRQTSHQRRGRLKNGTLQLAEEIVNSCATVVTNRMDLPFQPDQMDSIASRDSSGSTGRHCRSLRR